MSNAFDRDPLERRLFSFRLGRLEPVKARFCAILAAVFVAVGPVANAQQPAEATDASPEPQLSNEIVADTEFTEAQLDAFARAFLDIEILRMQYDQEYGEIEDPDQVRQLELKFEQDANQRVIEAGLTLDEYWRISEAADSHRHVDVDLYLRVGILEVADTDVVTQLDLGGQNLTAVPKSIARLTNLQVLHLDDNRLTLIPEFLGELRNLEFLKLDNNQIRRLPESIGSLANLKTLDLSSNRLTTLPQSIGNLRNLELLDLYDNQLKELPESIIRLTNLEMLSLRGNDFPPAEEARIGRLLPDTSVDF